MLTKKSSSDDENDDDDFSISHYTWIPSIEELQKRNIPVQYFDQEPGDLVFINSNVYHWVWSQVQFFCNIDLYIIPEWRK